MHSREVFLFGGIRLRDSMTFGTSVRRSSRSAFGRSTGNDVSGHYKRHYFLFFFFFLRRLLFSQKECSDQETYLVKVDGTIQKPFQTHSTILEPSSSYLGACRQCSVAFRLQQAGIVANHIWFKCVNKSLSNTPQWANIRGQQASSFLSKFSP